MQTLGFGGGCHWCTEAVFAALAGVTSVEQGFMRSAAPADSWSEAVRVTFDPDRIDLATLIEVHVRTHSATSNHAMRGKYRSAIYSFNPDQASQAQAILDRLQAEFDGALITQVLAFEGFKPSQDVFQRYYETNPERPFCQRYIDPKLALIRKRFAAHMLGSETCDHRALGSSPRAQTG